MILELRTGNCCSDHICSTRRCSWTATSGATRRGVVRGVVGLDESRSENENLVFAQHPIVIRASTSRSPEIPMPHADRRYASVARAGVVVAVQSRTSTSDEVECARVRCFGMKARYGEDPARPADQAHQQAPPPRGSTRPASGGGFASPPVVAEHDEVVLDGRCHEARHRDLVPAEIPNRSRRDEFVRCTCGRTEGKRECRRLTVTDPE